MGRTMIFVYGVVSYLIFQGAWLYSIGFVGNMVVPKSIDSGTSGPFGPALLVNAFLLGLFVLQHSVMARPSFKKWWTGVVPQPIERSTYVLLSSLLLFLLFWLWRPMPDIVWIVGNSVGRIALLSLFWIGWLLVSMSTFLINHFDFLGLRQVYLCLRGERYTDVGFSTSTLYKCVRHPIMLGFIIAFWGTPRMSAGHLVFAIASTAYILLALRLEERDLVSIYGEVYREYKKRVPMLIPLPGKKR